MSAVGSEADLLERIEAYFDAAPRPAAGVEEHGALTLFVSRTPWRLYARPRLGLGEEDVGADDVAAVRVRQRELGVREAFEWVHETAPSLAGAAAAAGLRVLQVPLLALDAERWSPPPQPARVELRMLGAGDPSLPGTQAVIELAFAAEGTQLGDAGPEARDLAVPRLGDLGFLHERLRRGLTAMAVAEGEAEGPLGGGSHQLLGDVTEVTGIGTLPSARRRGIGAAVTGRLVEDARERGAEIVFLSAAGAAVARVYERLGFRRIGTACFGSPAEA
jgi:GNAT superfamily N-acetyltransferase